MENQSESIDQYVKSALLIIKDSNLHQNLKIYHNQSCNQEVCTVKLVEDLLAAENIDNKDILKKLTKQVSINITKYTKNKRIMKTVIDALHIIFLNFENHDSMNKKFFLKAACEEDDSIKSLLRKKFCLKFEGKFRCECGHSGSLEFNSNYLCESIEADRIFTGLDHTKIQNIALLPYPLLNPDSEISLFTDSRSKIFNHLQTKYLKNKCTSSSCNKLIDLQNLELKPFHGIFIINIINRNHILYSTESFLLLNSIPFTLDLSKRQVQTPGEKLYLKSITMTNGFDCKVVDSSYIITQRSKFYYESIVKGFYPNCLIYSSHKKNYDFQLNHFEFMRLMRLSGQFDLLRSNKNWLKPQLSYWEIIKEDLKNKPTEVFGMRTGHINTNKSEYKVGENSGNKIISQPTPSSSQIYPSFDEEVYKEDKSKKCKEPSVNNSEKKVNEGYFNYTSTLSPKNINYLASGEKKKPFFYNHFQNPGKNQDKCQSPHVETITNQESIISKRSDSGTSYFSCFICHQKELWCYCMNCYSFIADPFKGCERCNILNSDKHICKDCRIK